MTIGGGGKEGYQRGTKGVSCPQVPMFRQCGILCFSLYSSLWPGYKGVQSVPDLPLCLSAGPRWQGGPSSFQKNAVYMSDLI